MNNLNLIDLVKFYSWWWLRHQVKGFSYDINQWWDHPADCLGSIVGTIYVGL